MALERETDAILRVLAERTIAERASCRLEALTGEGIPPGIRSFFRAETRRRLEEDLRGSSWFTSVRESDAGAARLARAFLISLTGAYEFKRQEFLDTLDLAVHFVANYLCRPQWTLENFLFDRSPRVTLTALAEGLSYVAEYRYLGDLALRSLQQRGSNEVNREQFRVLVEKIDEEVIRQHNARELAALPRPLFSFFQISGTAPGGGIPVEALLFFFEDKKLRILKEYIHGICHLRNQSFLTLEQLTKLVEDLLAGKTDPQPTPAPSAHQGSSTPVPDLPAPEPGAQVSPGTPSVPEAEIPAEPQPAQEPPSAPAQATTRPAASAESQKVNIALSLTFAGLKSKGAQRQALPGIETLILPEQRDRFITNVFKGDAAHYAGALAMLSSLKTSQEAESYLEELYRTNTLDPHAADVVEFSDAIRRRYATIEKEP